MNFHIHRKTYFSLLTLITILFFHSHTLLAAEATFSWLPNTGSNLAGYKVYYGVTSGHYDYVTDVHFPTPNDGRVQASIGGLSEGTTYYFAATAYDTSGVESDYSTEAVYSPPPPNPAEDSDNDGLSDDDELNIYLTDPNNPDTDNDGYEDGYEVVNGYDPLDPDSNPQQNVVIIDNGETGTSFTGEWFASHGEDYYGTQSVYSKTPGDIYRYDAALNGEYELSLWWTEYSSRCTEVSVEIYDGSTLVDTLTVNQQMNGGQWNILGNYSFTGAGAVEIVSQNNACSTNVDAVQFAGGSSSVLDYISVEGPASVNEDSSADYNVRAYYTNGNSQLVEPVWSITCPDLADISITGLFSTHDVNQDEYCTVEASYKSGALAETAELTLTIKDGVPPPSELILDNGKAGTSFTGDWYLSGGADYYETQSVYSKTAGSTYAYDASLNGEYELSLWWTEYSSRCTDASVEIYDGSTLIDTLSMNQQVNGGQWNPQGHYTFTGSGSVVIVSQGSACSTNADAVRFIPVSEFVNLIIDNGEAGTSLTGDWYLSGGADYYETQSVYSKTAGSTYAYDASLNGEYELSLWWTEYSSRCTDASVEIYDGSTLIDTLSINQQVNGGQWNPQGHYSFTGSGSVVIVSQGDSCSTNADAVQFVEVP